MWDSYFEDFVEALFPWSKPGSGKRSLGVWAPCRSCEGKGYLKKSANVWHPCPECYAGHFWVPPSPEGEECPERGAESKQNVQTTEQSWSKRNSDKSGTSSRRQSFGRLRKVVA
jgi:hypothetical protein